MIEILNLLKIILSKLKTVGDMKRSVYDPNLDDIVDNSEKLEGSTKTQVQDHTPKTHILNSHSAPSDNISMNSKKITSLANPTSGQDATTRAWVQGDRLKKSPDYDSGWFTVGAGADGDKTHSLNTMNLLVEVFSDSDSDHNTYLYGFPSLHKGYFSLITPNGIKIHNDESTTKYFRIMIWKF